MWWTSPGKRREKPSQTLLKKTLMYLVFEPFSLTRGCGELSLPGWSQRRLPWQLLAGPAAQTTPTLSFNKYSVKGSGYPPSWGDQDLGC